MKNHKQEFVIREIEGQFVVVDRQSWDQEKPEAIRSTVGSVRLAAGPFPDRTSAERALGRLTIA